MLNVEGKIAIVNAAKQAVQTIVKEKYFDVNLAHLQELLEENEQIQVKRETLRSWAHEIHHVKRAKRKRTKARKRRERMESPGLLLLSAVPVIVIAVFSEPFPDLAGLSPVAIVAMTYLILFPMSYCQ